MEVDTMNSPLRHLGKRVDDFVYSHAIELLGGGADAYMHLAARYESLGWLAEAVETYKKAIELRPHQALCRFKLAQVYFRLERFSEAMNACQEALQMDKDFVPAYMLKGTLHQKLGNEVFGGVSAKRWSISSMMRRPIAQSPKVSLMRDFMKKRRALIKKLFAFLPGMSPLMV